MKAVVITGASTGIGRACALLLDSKGFRVFAGVRKEADGAALHAEASGPLTPVYIDVTDEASIAAMADQVHTAVGSAGLAGLVNNAGSTLPGPVEYLALSDFVGNSRSIWSAPSRSPRRCCRCCAPVTGGSSTSRRRQARRAFR